MTDNVVSFDKTGTREQLLKVLAMYDEGIIESIVLVGQGIQEDGKRTIVPFCSAETSLAQATVACKVIDEYASNRVIAVLADAERVDA